MSSRTRAGLYMPLVARWFSVQKNGNPPEYNDDAAAADVQRGRFAVADGAAESGFAGVWSRAMVRQFAQESSAPCDAWSDWLKVAQQHWLDELKDVTIPYYGQPQFERGAFATFLGLAVAEAQDNLRPWHAVAVGDSCLFQTSGDRLLEVFPLRESAQFGRFPKLVGSRSNPDEVAAQRSQSMIGHAADGDRLWLLSDALAKWCLTAQEASQPPWRELAEQTSSTRTPDEFATWIATLRSERNLENDDVTALVVET